jgi:branched-chain amino acid transport system substrate-binding protein
MIAAALLAAAQLTTPTVYSSLPEHGPGSLYGVAIERGARLALADAGSPLRLVTLNDANRHGWTPERAAADARTAAADQNAIGYIGEFHSGASQVALPILNEAGIAMISPSNTAPGLTRSGPGTQPGEPEKYYPTGARTYFRLAPNDHVHGVALGGEMARSGCRRAAVLDDGEEHGMALAATAARRVSVVVRRHVARHVRYAALARALRHARADCMLYAGLTTNSVVALFRDVGRALPGAKLFGTVGIDPALEEGIPASVARRTLVTSTTLSPEAYPAAAQRIDGLYHDVWAAYGYEAMRLFIDAYASAGPKRRAIVDWLHGVRHRQGVIGTYGFDARGDTTLRTVGLYQVFSGGFAWLGPISG